MTLQEEVEKLRLALRILCQAVVNVARADLSRVLRAISGVMGWARRLRRGSLSSDAPPDQDGPGC